MRIWEAATGKEQTTPVGRIGLVVALALAPDGSWLATDDEDGTVRIRDVATGRKRAALVGHVGLVTLAVAPDGTWLAVGGEDGTVRIWDVISGKERGILVGHTSWVRAVAVAPDGSWLATGGQDGTVRVWDVATRRAEALMRIDGSIRATAWIGSNALAVGGSAGLHLFDFLTGTGSAASVQEQR